MDYLEFLTKVVGDGLDAAKRDYAGDREKLEGAIAGFEVCRGKSPSELAELLSKATGDCQVAFRDQAGDYWRVRTFEAEVEWVCNVVSAVLVNEGREPIAGWLPTARGALKAIDVLNTAERGRS